MELPLYFAHNYHFRRAQFQKIAGLKNVKFLCVLPSGNAKCFVILLQKKSNTVKSHDLPHQGIGPALSLLNNATLLSKVPSSQKTAIHEVFIF